MSEKNNGKDDNLNDFINQIENLQLPKRLDNRRNVYLGEQLSCWIKFDKWETKVEIIDLSSRGVALVETARVSNAPFVEGQKVFLEFSRGSQKHFTIEANISNISQILIHGRELQRIGIHFKIRPCSSREQYHKSVSEEIIPCKSYIRPQASCLDPFFFNELVLFQVDGFSSSGVDLLVSARCKTILPFQPIELDIYFPGRGRFVVQVINSDIHYRAKKNQYRIFARFINPEKAFLDAVSEYLIMFSNDVYPKKLREIGFSCGDLSQAFDLSYSKLGENVIPEKKLSPTLLAYPFKNKLKKTDLENTRSISCKLGPHIVATMGLVFVNGHLDRSLFKKQGYLIDDEILKSHVELVNLYISSEIILVDILLPLLQHLIRMSLQSQAKYLLLESSAQMKPILNKIGFTECHENSPVNQVEDSKQKLYLMSLHLKKVLLNEGDYLAKNIWIKVYKNLYDFFKSQIELKNAAKN